MVTVVLVSCHSHNKVLQTGRLKTVEMYSLSVLEAGHLKNPSVGRAGSFQKLRRRTCARPASAHRVVVRNPWRAVACGHITPISASIITWHSPCVPVFS